MKFYHTIKFFSLIVAIGFNLTAFAQGTEGDALPSFIGKTAESKEVAELISSYKLEAANETRYTSSKSGVELLLKNGVLSEINLFKTSPVFGSFTGKLPKGLMFDMSSASVKKILGKPTVTYTTSGYSEFDLPNCTISCWFENDKLSQVTLVSKSADK